MDEVKAKYRCTQSELYAIAGLLFNNLEFDRTAFAAKKVKYDLPYVASLRALRTAAMALPDEEDRNGVHQALKNLLPGLVIPVKDNFNDLRGYIRDAWPNEDPVPRYEQAGQIRYNNIKSENWEEIVALNVSMIQFIADNSTLLATPGGMPGTFAAKVQTDSTNFDAVYNPFMSSKETSTATAAKLTADNTLFDAMTTVMQDGTEMIFRTVAEQRKRYVFTTLKDLVSPPGSSSLRVTVKAEVTNIPQPGKPVTIQADGGIPITVNTDANGIAPFPNIDPARYNGTVVVGTTTKNFVKEVNTGTEARLEVFVTP